MSEITLEQRVEALEKNMKAILGIKPLYKGENDMHEPNEPLIKDEKIRKAVRAWAEANGLDSLPIHYDSIYNRFCDAPDFCVAIDFYKGVKGEGLHGGYSYYLNELCGEEE